MNIKQEVWEILNGKFGEDLTRDSSPFVSTKKSGPYKRSPEDTQREVS